MFFCSKIRLVFVFYSFFTTLSVFALFSSKFPSFVNLTIFLTQESIIVLLCVTICNIVFDFVDLRAYFQHLFKKKWKERWFLPFCFCLLTSVSLRLSSWIFSGMVPVPDLFAVCHVKGRW